MKIFLILIFSFAFFLRAQNFTQGIQFDSDFGRDSLFALRIMRGDLTLLGPQASVGGFYLGPLYFYLIAIVYGVVGLKPEIMTIIFLAFGAATVVIGYHVLKTYVSKLAGILFVLFTLSHPSFVMASRSATNQPLMPLVTVLFIWCFFKAITTQHWKWFALTGLIFGLFFHVHFSAMLLLPPVMILIFIYAQGTWKKKLLLTGLTGSGILIMLGPLILFDFTHSFITSKAFLEYVKASALGQGIAENLPHLSAIDKLGRIAWLSIQNKWISGTIFLIAILELATNWKKIKKSSILLSLILFSGLSVLLLLKYNGYLYDYYLLIPMTVILMTVVSLLSLLKAKPFVIILAFIVFFAHWSMIRYPSAFRTIDNLSKVTDVIKKDIDQTGVKSFTVFKDSSDRLTGIGYEYRFLLERDGYSPVFEQSYEKADVLYFIREEGDKDPLISTNWETTQFGATKKEFLGNIPVSTGVVPLFRLSN